MEKPESNITITYNGNGNGSGSGQPYFSTLDSYIAGYLFDLGHKYQLVNENGSGKYSFRFPASDALLQALHEYQSGAAIVNALQFSKTIKAVRGEILRKRENQNGSTYNYSRVK
jgi:hypothetical protein